MQRDTALLSRWAMAVAGLTPCLAACSPVNVPCVNLGMDEVEVWSGVTASSCRERTTKIFVPGRPGSPTTSPCVSRRRDAPAARLG